MSCLYSFHSFILICLLTFPSVVNVEGTVHEGSACACEHSHDGVHSFNSFFSLKVILLDLASTIALLFVAVEGGATELEATLVEGGSTCQTFITGIPLNVSFASSTSIKGVMELDKPVKG